jgi:hypothetical protein
MVVAVGSEVVVVAWGVQGKGAAAVEEVQEVVAAVVAEDWAVVGWVGEVRVG